MSVRNDADNEIDRIRLLIAKQNDENIKEKFDEYFKLFDDVKGLNNYAKEIMEKVKYLDNVSSSWKTFMTKEKMIRFIQESSISNSAENISNIFKDNKILASLKPLTPSEIKFKKKAQEVCNGNKENKQKFTFKSNFIDNPSTSHSDFSNQVKKGTLSFGEANIPSSSSLISNNNQSYNTKPIVSSNFTSYHPTNILKRSLSQLSTSNVENNHSPKLLKMNETKSISNQEEQSDNSPFRSALDQLNINNQKKHNSNYNSPYSQYGSNKKSLGTRKGARSDFIPPTARQSQNNASSGSYKGSNSNDNTPTGSSHLRDKFGSVLDNDQLKQFQPEMIELILSEIMDNGRTITWDDIAGLEPAKKILNEIVILPMVRPDIFTGLRGPPKGLLLFGPPGTGKTLIGKCIACHSKSTFFSISASSLTSKWVGEGEKMVKALFVIARLFQPSVVFIDEIDSLLSQRSESEHESSRRIKTEFLVQLDGVTTGDNERLLLVGATNRPHEIDEAARRRFVKRLYIPLPTKEARGQLVQNLMKKERHSLTESDINVIVDNSNGYSGADMANVCREAALGPVRELPLELMEQIAVNDLRSISFEDFNKALTNVKPSVSQKDLEQYIQWNQTYGSY